MTRNDIKTKYNFIGENKDMMLFRKGGEFTYGIGYCGNISLKNGKAVFNGKTYNDLETLDNALVEWEKSQPYPIDTYCPMTRESCRTESRIIWHLTEKMGFERDKSRWDASLYVRNIGPNSQLRFNVRQDLENEKVNITSQFGGMTFTQSVDNAEDGIAVIDSIISCNVLMGAKDMVDIISVCGEKITAEIEAFIPTKENFFGIKQVSFKDLMITRLESILNQLKGE
jgi:hypothetical protein